MFSRSTLFAALLACALATGCSQFNTNLTTQTSSSSLVFLSPSSAPAGGPGFTLTANGAGFVTGAVVLWNGAPLTTTFVSSNVVTAVVPAANIATPGTVQINIQIPGSAVSGASSTSATTTTEVSNLVNFTIAPVSAPAPAITSLSPASIGAGSRSFTLTVTGTNFVSGTNGSVIFWNGVAITPTTVTGTTTASATIPANLVNTTGTAVVSISNAASGGASSTPATFTITSAAPTLAVAGQSNAEATNSVPAAATANATGVNATAANATGATAPGVTSDLRLVVFAMASADGVNENPGATQNIFVRDTCAGAAPSCTPSTTLVSTALDGQSANGDSSSPSVSADGRYIAFVSAAGNLTAEDTNAVADVFIRDTCWTAVQGCVPSTHRVSVATDGTQANDASAAASISATGRYVTFRSQATNLDAAASVGSSGFAGIFVHDTCAGAAAGCVPSTQRLNVQN